MSDTENKIQAENEEREEKIRSVSSIKRTDPIVLELRFLRRYINLDGKVKTKRQIKLFLSALQRAIVGRQIRKTSKYAADIEVLQDDLIELLATFKNKTKLKIRIDEAKETHILNLLGRKAEPKGLRLLKEFTRLQGKTLSKLNIRKIHNKIGRHLNRKKEANKTLRDNVSLKLLEIVEYLREIYNGKGAKRVIALDSKVLNGIDLGENNEDQTFKKKVYLE